MNKFSQATAALLLCAAVGFPSEGDLRLLPSDECGDPEMSSEIFFIEPASVVEIVDGETLVVIFSDWDLDIKTSKFVTTPRYERVTIKLDCIDAPPMSDPIGEVAARRLEERLLGKDITVSFRSHTIDEALPFVEVNLAGGHPISEGVAQIEQGLAKVRTAGPCNVGRWAQCQYKLAETRARNDHLGIWEAE